MTNNKNTYCPAPWHGGYFTYNQQSVCCAYSVVNTTSIVEFYKSDLVSNLKKNIIAGTPPDECNTSTIDPRKMKIVGDQINSMRNRMLNSDADNNEWEKFKQFTHDFDTARNESFEQVFGFKLD